MTTSSHTRPAPKSAFTLIELLVVISIIALLAALVVTGAGIASKRKILTLTTAELSNVQTAIASYKAKKGPNPPDNVAQTLPFVITSPSTNQLFYELCGTVLNPQGAFSSQFYPSETIIPALITSFFHAGGFINSSPDPSEIRNYFPTLLASQIRNINTTSAPVHILAVSASGPHDIKPPGLPSANPINYVSTNPTNNTSTYDLWVDVVIGGRTYRISNWSTEPQIVN